MITDFPARQEYETTGGILRFQFTPVNHIAYFPDEENIRYKPGPVSLSSPVVFVVGKRWMTGYSSYDKQEYTEQGDQNENGFLIKESLKGFLPGIDPEVLNLFQQMQHHEFIVKCTDANGRVRILGTKEKPLLFTYDAGTGRPARSTGITYQFYGENLMLSPFYNFSDGTIPDNSFGDDFNEDFA